MLGVTNSANKRGVYRTFHHVSKQHLHRAQNHMLKVIGCSLVMTMFQLVGVSTAREHKGYCPPMPPKPNVIPTAPTAPEPTAHSPNAQFAGSETLMVVISETGYVCDAQILRGLDKETDDKTMKTVRQWHLKPPVINGHHAPTTAIVNVFYWRKNGELIQQSDTTPNPQAEPTTKPAK